MRCWNNEVLQNFEGVVEAILRALRRDCEPPFPTFPRKGGRGRPALLQALPTSTPPLSASRRFICSRNTARKSMGFSITGG